MKRFQVFEVNTGETVRVFDDKRRADSLAAALNDEFKSQGLKYKVKAVPAFGAASLFGA